MIRVNTSYEYVFERVGLCWKLQGVVIFFCVGRLKGFAVHLCKWTNIFSAYTMFSCFWIHRDSLYVWGISLRKSLNNDFPYCWLSRLEVHNITGRPIVCNNILEVMRHYLSLTAARHQYRLIKWTVEEILKVIAISYGTKELSAFEIAHLSFQSTLAI